MGYIAHGQSVQRLGERGYVSLLREAGRRVSSQVLISPIADRFSFTSRQKTALVNRRAIHAYKAAWTHRDSSVILECEATRSTWPVGLLEAPRTCYDSLRTCRGDRQSAASQHSPLLRRSPSPQNYPTARNTRRSRSRPRESRLLLS